MSPSVPPTLKAGDGVRCKAVGDHYDRLGTIVGWSSDDRARVALHSGLIICLRRSEMVSVPKPQAAPAPHPAFRVMVFSQSFMVLFISDSRAEVDVWLKGQVPADAHLIMEATAVISTKWETTPTTTVTNI